MAARPAGQLLWLRRVPRAPAYSAGRGIFEFHHPTDYPIALATDLQVRPPGSDYCRTCASATGDGLRFIAARMVAIGSRAPTASACAVSGQ